MLGWHYLQHLVWWSYQFYFMLFLIIYLFFSNSYRIAEQIFVLILSVLSCSWFCCLFFTKQFVVPVNHDCFSIGNVIILLINFFFPSFQLFILFCVPPTVFQSLFPAVLYFLYLFLKWRWGFDELSEFMSKKEKTHVLHFPWFKFKHKSSPEHSYRGLHSSDVFLEKQGWGGHSTMVIRMVDSGCFSDLQGFKV